MGGRSSWCGGAVESPVGEEVQSGHPEGAHRGLAAHATQRCGGKSRVCFIIITSASKCIL